MKQTTEKEGFIEFEYFSLWIEGGNIHFVCKPDAIITLDIAKYMIVERLKLSNGIMRPILMDVRNILIIEVKARQFFASKEANHLLSASAILLNNALIRLAINIFILIDKPQAPTQLFTDQKLALHWLESFKHN